MLLLFVHMCMCVCVFVYVCARACVCVLFCVCMVTFSSLFFIFHSISNVWVCVSLRFFILYNEISIVTADICVCVSVAFRIKLLELNHIISFALLLLCVVCVLVFFPFSFLAIWMRWIQSVYRNHLNVMKITNTHTMFGGICVRFIHVQPHTVLFCLTFISIFYIFFSRKFCTLNSCNRMFEMKQKRKKTIDKIFHWILNTITFF